jgi:hypothetical protein
MKKSTEKLLLYGGLAFAVYYLFLRPQTGTAMAGLGANYRGAGFAPGWEPKLTSGNPGGLPGLPGIRSHLNYSLSSLGTGQDSVSPYHRSRYMPY